VELTRVANATGVDEGVLERLLGPRSSETFFRDFFSRAPLLVKGAAPWLCEHATVDTCRRLVGNPDVDLLLAREGELFQGRRPSLDEARHLFDAGYAWALCNVDRGDSTLAEIGRTLASEIHGTLHLQLHRAPRGQLGFGWHCDCEEVFVVQTAGRKRFLLRQNTLHPSPLAHELPMRLSAESDVSPIEAHVLSPGDCLYIPSGYWHVAEAEEESVTVSLGVLAPSPLDALALVSAELARDPKWRRRLPAIGRATPMTESERQSAWRACLAELAKELDGRLSSRDLPVRLFAHTGWWRRR
jgi:ribosomal protein L16 Arg81 hydroxylase